MKSPFTDTIFVRLFLLMFFTLTLSFLVGREVITGFGFASLPPGLSPHPFGLWPLIFRMTGIGLAAWIAARWLAKPIQRMAHAAYELGENLNRPPLDETAGPVEVRQASTVFNQMQVRLNRQLAERSRFLAAVSHDLRTPLTRLRLRAEKISDPQLQASIREDVNEMAAMIDAALDYLRGTGQPEAPSLLDITALVNSLAEDAQDRGETVTVSGQAAPIRVQPGAMRRCLNNLIENALRYGGRADVSIEETADGVTIAICDAGPGIPEDKLEAVFAPFFRLEESRNKNTGGIGLGLSIARDIARQQGGSLTLNNAPQGGLVATLMLRK
jgi:signal transduction histidine kinase